MIMIVDYLEREISKIYKNMMWLPDINSVLAKLEAFHAKGGINGDSIP